MTGKIRNFRPKKSAKCFFCSNCRLWNNSVQLQPGGDRGAGVAAAGAGGAAREAGMETEGHTSSQVIVSLSLSLWCKEFKLKDIIPQPPKDPLRPLTIDIITQPLKYPLSNLSTLHFGFT